ncbi:MAG: PAS domain-containing sensor histidine kinase [Pseudorhodoplanes sp.]|nr:PAS domain-containing sensor histidine kinase [Pseudorhodoplanes sp.]
MSVAKPVREYIDSLVHPSVQQEPLAAARHRAFIAPRLLGSLIALAAFPAFIVMRGVPTLFEVAVFAWLIVPIFAAYFLSRTGRYEDAHVISSLALTILIAAVAWNTGGIASFAAIWLVVVPLEAALSASRRVVALAASFALSAAALLVTANFAGLLLDSAISAQDQAALAALGVLLASLYAICLALGAESLARVSFRLLGAEEDRYRLLARNMTDVIARHGPHGAIRFISPAAESLLGIRADQLLGHGLFDRVHVADRPAYLTALADASANGDTKSVEFRMRRTASNASGGSDFVWVEMRCRPLDQESVAHAGEVVSVMRDITARKIQEEAIEIARTESDRANAAKSRFLATMSHELRTPLNAIIGFSEMLTKDEQMRLDAQRRRDYAKLINDSGHHLLAVVNDILDMSKMETGDFEITPEPFAPAEVIRNCCDLLALKAREAGLDLVLRVPDDLPDVTADKRALKQVLLNLLSNAVKFTDRGGQVTVSAHAEMNRMVIAVEDNGIGISDSDLPQLGNPFFQARSAYDRRHDGTGLGLSIVKGLVALHGGDVEINSALGKGTRIVITMPVNCESARRIQPVSEFPAPVVRPFQQSETFVRKSA